MMNSLPTSQILHYASWSKQDIQQGRVGWGKAGLTGNFYLYAKSWAPTVIRFKRFYSPTGIGKAKQLS